MLTSELQILEEAPIRRRIYKCIDAFNFLSTLINEVNNYLLSINITRIQYQKNAHIEILRSSILPFFLIDTYNYFNSCVQRILDQNGFAFLNAHFDRFTDTVLGAVQHK